MLKDGTTREGVSWKQAAEHACSFYDESRGVYVVKVKDLWTRVRSVGQPKSVQSQLASMSAEQLTALMAQMQELLAKKQS